MPEDDAVAVAPLDFDLPEFEGNIPVDVLTVITGSGQRIHRAIHHGEKPIFVVEVELVDVAHPMTKQGIKRKQKTSVLDLYELQGKAGRRILAALRQAYREADDQRHGRQALPLEKTGLVLGPDGYTDEHGNLLSDEDLAEIRGHDIAAAANDESLDPVLIVYADGGRHTWPDDFGPRPGGRPRAGEELADADGTRFVRQVLDIDSGAVIEEWTDEQEDARLAALEDEARRAEAAEDVAVVASLEAARERAQAAAPWEDYDAYSVNNVKGVIAEIVDVDEVRAVVDYEGSHKKRKSILDAAVARLDVLQGEG